MQNLPVATPADIVEISPESLEVANAYLQNPNIDEVAALLQVPTQVITTTLAQREVKSYIDSVFFDLGYNNRFKLRTLMDSIIAKKLEELDEAEIGSSKDITELLALSHKMTMEMLDKEIQLEKIRLGNTPKTQVNMQLNDYGGDNYSTLVERLMRNESPVS